jgi:hypothetical protein
MAMSSRIAQIEARGVRDFGIGSAEAARFESFPHFWILSERRQ